VKRTVWIWAEGSFDKHAEPPAMGLTEDRALGRLLRMHCVDFITQFYPSAPDSSEEFWAGPDDILSQDTKDWIITDPKPGSTSYTQMLTQIGHELEQHVRSIGALEFICFLSPDEGSYFRVQRERV
jgi:hypothetical protein